MNKNKPITILMAEDNATDVMITKEALVHAKLLNTLHVVSDGIEAMDFLYRRGKYAKAPRPDLILLDLNMPRKDGREALREIKADPQLRRIPVIVLTTSQAEEDIARTYDLGASSFITKPRDFESLVSLVQTINSYWFETVLVPASEN
jgi:CheY-like chemotaxis protein